MTVSNDRKYTKNFVYNLLEGIKGKTLGEVDTSGQFQRAIISPKITGIAGDVIEQSVFKYQADSRQECDIEIDGILTELKTTGVRIPKSEFNQAKGKTGDAYNIHLGAKEGISITGVTFDPTYQTDFLTSHFWEKAKHLLIVFYEYRPYDKVPAYEFRKFPIIDYCYNSFSDTERNQLQSDWEIVRDYLETVYSSSSDIDERNNKLVGFTHILRPNLLLIELVPGFKRKNSQNGKISYQKPRYRLKKTFVDYIVRGHFDKSRENEEVSLKESFNSFKDLDLRCHQLSLQYKDHTLERLREEFSIEAPITTKDFTSICILRMFGANCKRLNQISDFVKSGIIAKTITLTAKGGRTEDMKLQHIDFEEWADRDTDFNESEIYSYFCEHSFLCPIFIEDDSKDISKTTFQGFKRFSFDDSFMEEEVLKMWNDSRHLIHNNELEWVYELDKDGNKIKNKSGSFRGAPNFPKSVDYNVFFRGGNNDSSDAAKTENVNGIRMLPQFFWLKGAYIAEKLQTVNFL